MAIPIGETWENTPLPLPEPRSGVEALLYGNTALGEKDFARARDLLELACLSCPGCPDAWTALGWAWVGLGARTRAGDAALKALAVRPDPPDFQAMLLLRHLGTANVAAVPRWINTLDGESRWVPAPGGVARWDRKPLAGRSLAILDAPGDGYGDHLQGLALLPWLAALDGPVWCCFPAKLHALFRSNPAVASGRVRLAESGTGASGRLGPEVAGCAAWAALPETWGGWLKGWGGQPGAGSLAALSAWLAASVPRLAPPPDRATRWRQELAAPPGTFTVAINWRGKAHDATDSNAPDRRGWPLAAATPLAALPGVRLVSVQVGPGREQLADCPFPVLDLAPRLDAGGAFLDTAAVLACRDLLVTSDTAVAHLAGCLGTPVWMLLADPRQGGERNGRFDWGLEGPHQANRWPVYPSMRLLFQQTTWEALFEEVAAGIRALGRDEEPVFRPSPCPAPRWPGAPSLVERGGWKHGAPPPPPPLPYRAGDAVRFREGSGYFHQGLRQGVILDASTPLGPALAARGEFLEAEDFGLAADSVWPLVQAQDQAGNTHELLVPPDGLDPVEAGSEARGATPRLQG